MSDYDQGYRVAQGLSTEMPTTSDGWAGYNYGLSDRQHDLKMSQLASSTAGGQGGGASFGGASGLGSGAGSLGAAAAGAAAPAVFMLVVLFYVALNAIGAAVSALLGGLVVMLCMRVFDCRFHVGYAAAYQAAFASLFVYLVVTFVMSMVLDSPHDSAVTRGLKAGVGLMDLRFAAQLARNLDALTAVLPMLAFLHLPGLFASAVALSRMLGGPLSGYTGYPRALLMTTAVTVVGIAGTYTLIVFLLLRADDEKLFNPGYAVPTLIGITVSTLFFALVGGLLAALVLLPLTRRLSAAPVGNFANAYVTAALSLLAFGIASTVTAFIFQGSSAFSDLLYGLARSRQRDAFFAAHQPEMLQALPGFILTQIPGVMAAALVFTANIRGVYAGVVGYLKAVAVALCTTFLPYVLSGAALFTLVMV